MPETFLSALKGLGVEDDKELAALVRTGLEDEGFNVTLSFDGGSGLRQAEMHAFDIVVLDVMLPVLNGFRSHQTTTAAGGSHPHPLADGTGCTRGHREGPVCRCG